MPGSKLTSKEREILERQRKLAAKLSSNNNNDPPSSTLPSSSSSQSSKQNSAEPPVHPFFAPRRTSGSNAERKAAPSHNPYKRNSITSSSAPSSNTSSKQCNGANSTAVIDLTEDATKTTVGSVAAPSSLARPIRPTLKNKRSLQQAAILAAQKHRQEQDKKTAELLAPQETSNLPVLKRKAKTGGSSSVGAGSLAQLVQNVSDGNQNSMNKATSYTKVEPEDYWKNLRDWDFCTQYVKNQQSTQHISSGKDNADDDAAVLTHRPLPNVFMSAKHYMAVWAPLCMAECRAQILQEATAGRGSSMGRSRPMAVTVEVLADGFRPGGSKKSMVGVDGPSGGSWNVLDDFETGLHLKVQAMRGMRHNGDAGSVQIMANDLCLLLVPTEEQFLTNRHPPPTPENPHRYEHAGLIAHAEVTRKGIHSLILKVSKRKWAKYGVPEKMFLVPLGSNVTALREFTALCWVDHLPLQRFLLGQHLEQAEYRRKLSQNANSTQQLLDRMGGKEALGKGFLEYASKKFNSSQLTAIAASANEYGEGGFTLIKGPPGTGKTTTLVAVLNSLHIRQYNKYYEEVRRLAAQSTGTKQAAMQMARRAKPRLLVCAPSNAAVDNIILKIMQDGFMDGQGQRYNPSMLRVGVGQSHAVKVVSLESKVDSILQEHMSDLGRLDSSIAGYRLELSRITRDMASLRARIQAMQKASPWPLSRDWEIRIDDSTFDETGRVYFVNHKEKTTTYEVPPPPEPNQAQFPATSMPEYRTYVARVVKLVENYFGIKTHLERCTILKGAHDQGLPPHEVRQSLETHVLNDVHVVMTTLGTAGHRTLEGVDKFEVVVVDEAAQSVEPATLAALRLGSRHAVLVGDPQQLPATIFNVSGRKSKYDRSLFQRLEEAGQPVYMLNEQYRMHPLISHFPRHIFYGGNLRDGPNVMKTDYGNPLMAILQCAVPHFKPFTVLDLDSQEDRAGTSLTNPGEVRLAVYLYQQLREFTRGLCTKSKVAILTPYAQQCAMLKRAFTEALGEKNFEQWLDVHTVDAYQGREANIVIFSAVRGAGSHGIGFLSDVRRMNVALTRAKHFLFVVARCQSIVVNPYWRDLVQHARSNKAVLKVPNPFRNNFISPVQWKLDESSSEGPAALQPYRAPPPPPPLTAEQLSDMAQKRPADPRRKSSAESEEVATKKRPQSYIASTPSLLDPHGEFLSKKPQDPRQKKRRN